MIYGIFKENILLKVIHHKSELPELQEGETLIQGIESILQRVNSNSRKNFTRKEIQKLSKEV